MWIAGTDWDDQLSDDWIRKVNSWFSELNQLQNIRIPRSLQQKKEAVKINLHTLNLWMLLKVPMVQLCK